MRAALLWTVNDFLALAILSGWSTKGKLACLVCMRNARASQLPQSSFWETIKKFRRLGHHHTRQIGWQVRNKCVQIAFRPHGKGYAKSRADGFGVTQNFTHFSILFELSYWDSLRLRHCIDIMHAEKNVFDNFFHTIMGSKKIQGY